jgi:uncharacterized linocin/CFP29 family protein
MMSNLGRDKLWSETPDLWADIDKAVMTEVGRLRVAQKVFPSQSLPNAANVSADLFNPRAMTIQEGITLPFMEISVEFALTQSQVDNEATLHTARTLAQRAARSVALAEDLLFFQGAGVQLPQGVRVTNLNSAGNGLLSLQGSLRAVPVARGAGGGYGEATFAALSQGISALITAGHPGPYALVLEATVFADTHAPVPNTLTTTSDRVNPMVEGRFYGTGTLPGLRGLLVSLGGDPTTVSVAQDAITAYTQEDQQGNYRFRVFERVQIVAREPEACLPIEFQAA